MSSPLITLISVWCMITFVTGFEIWKFFSHGPTFTAVFASKALKDLDLLTGATGCTSRGDLISRALQAYAAKKTGESND